MGGFGGCVTVNSAGRRRPFGCKLSFDAGAMRIVLASRAFPLIQLSGAVQHSELGNSFSRKRN